SDIFNESTKMALEVAARLTLETVGQRDDVDGWKKVFGETDESDNDADDLEKVVRAIHNPPKAYYSNGMA
ncbi:MAG: hypothetical protein COV79_01735, partial [Parcubacteria group bacterium CG11_big_fil_rev_8_21_14_0_20_41_14]